MSADGRGALLATRPEFPTLAKGVHLISHSLGAVPKQAREYANQFLDEWENESINAWHHVAAGGASARRSRRARARRRRRARSRCFPNVSTVQSFVASCFTFNEKTGPFAGRNKIVYDDLNFSTVHYVWQEQARRGAEFVVVKSTDGIHAPTEELLAAIDEKTLLVPISHVLFRSSAMYDAKRVIDRAHEMGALVLLDCYQSAGTVPLDLKAWDVRHGLRRLGEVGLRRPRRGATSTCVPICCRALNPMSTGWFSHAEPFAFDMGPMRYADDTWRMIGGTMPIPAVYTARAGWEIIARLGVDRDSQEVAAPDEAPSRAWSRSAASR